MPEFTYIDGMIGDAGYHVVCDDVQMTGDASVIAWLTDLLGPTPYSPGTILNLSPQTVRLFGAQRSVFYDTNNTSPAAVPTISHIEPASIALGGANVTLHVYGSGFVQRSVIVFNGGEEVTTFVSPYALTTIVEGATATLAGKVPVQVQTPAPGGGLSPGRWFYVIAPTEQTVTRYSRDRLTNWLIPASAA